MRRCDIEPVISGQMSDAICGFATVAPVPGLFGTSRKRTRRAALPMPAGGEQRSGWDGVSRQSARLAPRM